MAVDCGGRRSASVFINLAILEHCRSGWSGLPDVVHYRAGQGQKMLAKGATLRLCEEDCQPASVNVKLTLANSHIGKGCDRDTYSINSQRKLCGMSFIIFIPSARDAKFLLQLDFHFFFRDLKKISCEIAPDFSRLIS